MPLKILIAGDDPGEADLLLLELRRSGFNPDWQRVNSQEGFLDRLGPDLDIILSDYEMPGFGGPQALELLKRSGLKIPFILISGAIGEEAAVEVMKAGATDYVLKGRLERLGPAIRTAIERRRLQVEGHNNEERLRRNNDQLRRRLAHCPVVIYTLKIEGEQGVLVDVSDNVARLLGYSAQELCSDRGWAAYLHPEDRDRVLGSIGQTLRQGTLTIDYRVQHKDGTYLWIEDNRQAVREADGGIREIAGAWIDIRERRMLEAEVAVRDRRLNAFFSGAVAGLALLDKDLRYVQINDVLADMNGVRPEDHIGKSIRQIVPELERVVGPLFKNVMATGIPVQNIEFAGETPRHPGVQRHWIESIFPIAGIDGLPDGVGVIVVEVTERKRMEQSLRLSEERFRQLAENIQEVFWVVDTDRREMLYISPAYEDIWGRTCESLYAAPQTWLDAIHPEDRDQVLHAVVTRQLNGTYDEEYRIIRSDGSLRWIRDRAFPVRNASGEIYRVVGVAQDISERKRAHDQLREQATLLDEARDAIVVRDLAHNITYWNKSAERMYGWTSAEAIGQKASELLYSDIAPFEKAAEAVAKLGEWNGELQHVTKAGDHLLVEARWTLVCDSAGRPQSILTINTDITEKNRLQQQFLRAQRMESIGTLAGGIAHDLNNVLSPIMMSIDLLRLSSADQRTQDVLSTIQASARRGAEMVQQILSFARGVEGKRVVVDPAKMVTELEHLVHDTFPKNIVFRAVLPEGLPTFVADATQVHQVLLNLCVNARDAMPTGGVITVSAESIVVDETYATMTPDAEPGAYLVVKVEDTGTGIPQEVADKIFDPFFTTKAPGKGTGLGLSTVLTIVKSHGGFLRVQSELGRGTAFTVGFPVDFQQAGTILATTEEMHPRGHGELILVVDDEAALLTIMQQTLEIFGYRVLTASDGAEAIAIYAQHRNDVSVVLVDMMMPVIDGAGAIQVLKHINPHVKIIVASGLNADEEEASKIAELGVKYFLLKPYTAQTILVTLHRLLCK